MPTYLLTNEVILTELWKMLETNLAYSQDITTRVTQGKNVAGSLFKYRPGVVVTAKGDFPDISLPKSGWRTPTALTGSFTSGTWTFNVALYNTTKYAVTVKMGIRLSRSTNEDGSSASLICQTVSETNISLVGSVGDIKTDSFTQILAQIQLNNEYLFVEFRCNIMIPSSSTSAQHAFICDENPATREESVTTPTFTLGSTGWRQLKYFTEPPTPSQFNKLRCASEPPVSGAWNKLLYSDE